MLLRCLVHCKVFSTNPGFCPDSSDTSLFVTKMYVDIDKCPSTGEQKYPCLIAMNENGHRRQYMADSRHSGNDFSLPNISLTLDILQVSVSAFFIFNKICALKVSNILKRLLHPGYVPKMSLPGLPNALSDISIRLTNHLLQISTPK